MNFQNTSRLCETTGCGGSIKKFREEFFMPQHQGKDKIYFTGNSLGLQPKTAAAYLMQEMEDWAIWVARAILKPARPWYPYHEIFPKQLIKNHWLPPGRSGGDEFTDGEPSFVTW